MIVISAPLPWVEAHDQPCKGAEENRKNATTSLLSGFRPQKPQDSNTTSRQNTPVICFHKNGTTRSSRNQNTLQNTTHGTASGIKPPAKSNQREARASATQGRPATACLTNSRRRKAKGLAPDLCHKKHLKSLTGQTTNKNRKPNRRPIRKFPTCLAISALTWCLCLFTSLSRAYVLNNPSDYPDNANKPHHMTPQKQRKHMPGPMKPLKV